MDFSDLGGGEDLEGAGEGKMLIRKYCIKHYSIFLVFKEDKCHSYHKHI